MYPFVNIFKLASVKTRTKNREDLGVELYGIQQELARHQMLLENYHDKFAMCKQDRVTNEQTLADTRSNYKKTQNNNTEQHRRGISWTHYYYYQLLVRKC